jgi:hypothetical protein
MSVSRKVVDPIGNTATWSFDEVPRVGDSILVALGTPTAAPQTRQVARVIFAPISPGMTVNVEIQITYTKSR